MLGYYDEEAPVCTKLGPTRTHKTRTARRLPCGHEVEAGTVYEVEAWIVDGEFQTSTRCFHCYSELEADGML
jgi:hypothetical protein